MRIKFWGTRGSIAKPGPSTARYGGNTPCVEVRSARGTLIVLDCGTGGHALGHELTSAGEGATGHLLISHTHWDHIQGIPFFAPLFVPANEWHIYGPKGLGQSLRDTLAGQMEYAYFPVALEQLGARMHYHELVEGTFDIDGVRISTQYLNHTALTLGYRLEENGATLVYCLDHEPYSPMLASGEGEISGQDQRHAELLRDADLLIHDAHFTAEEYVGRVGWGHSPVDYVLRLCRYADVRKVALCHHDPLRDDDAVDRMVERARMQVRSTLEVIGAAEGDVVDLAPLPARHPARPVSAFHSETPIEPAIVEHAVLLDIADASLAAALSEAIRAEGIRTRFMSDLDRAQTVIAKDMPSLAVLEHDPPRKDALRTSQAIRRQEGKSGDPMPIIVIAADEDHEHGAAAGVSDWLIKPVSTSYARARIKAWSLRSACRWTRARLPSDEGRRIASLRALGILDTPPEDRFDRITRLAAAQFNVPVALVSLVDQNRQWFKSCYGYDGRETSRDAAFCSHVVYTREPMVVEDTFQDARFADNPLVLGHPRIRFYAGYPLMLDDGSCVGTLCLIDIRPRSLEEDKLARLRDFADLVVQEFRGGRAAA